MTPRLTSISEQSWTEEKRGKLNDLHNLSNFLVCLYKKYLSDSSEDNWLLIKVLHQSTVLILSFLLLKLVQLFVMPS